jgi:glycosyltransferase involved in cell wall biosynthesis
LPPPRITIVTAVFNRERTVADAIDSVRTQTYEHVEHVVVDGASTDGTLSSIEALRSPSMRVVSEPDDGIYDAVNKGMALATGDVLGLVHSDDLLADEAVLADVAAAFDDPAVDAVYGDLEYVSGENPDRVVRYWRAGEFSMGRLRYGWMPPHPTLFVRRRVIERHGVYDTRYRIAADYDAVLRWFAAGIEVRYVPRVLVRMRLGGESNASLRKVLRKSSEDYRALRSSGVGGAGTLLLKNAVKLPQFLLRRRA